MSNPLANESVLDKVKNRIRGNKANEVEAATGSIIADLVGMNRSIDIVAEACASCWDKKIPDDYTGRAEYVAKRGRTGHTSILEHSNFVMYLRIRGEQYTDDLISYLDWNRYLHHKAYNNKIGEWCILLGGSYRGYSDVYLNTDDLNNPVLKAVAGCLYTYAPSAGFEDICKLGLMDKSRFIDAEPDDESFKILTKYHNDPEGDHDLFTIIGLDDVNTLYTNLYKIDPEFAGALTTADLLEFVTVSVMFKNMTRACTHQLVRHRNGVTQESQRYVDYSKACFTSPTVFKPGKYDENHKYKIHFGPSGPMNMTLDEIGNAVCSLYGQLTNPVITGTEYALLREDARGYLPTNVQCRKIYMTFTYRMVFKALELREASGAQAEIRAYFHALGEWIRNHTNFSSKEITDTYTLPKLLIDEPIKIDIVEGVEESVVELTEEDYIKAAGLDNVQEDSE